MLTKTLNNLTLTLAVSVMTVAAAQAGGMDEKRMQQMMEMQQCMANIDQSRLEAMSAKAESMHRELQSLCKAGKRDQAQKTAMQYAQEMSQSDVMQEMKQCGEMARQMLQKMPMMSENDQDSHVCDSL